MKDYYQLNKKKIKFQFIFTFITFGVLFLVALPFSKQTPDSFNDVLLFILGWTGMVVMVSIIIHGSEYWYFTGRRKLFTQKVWVDFFEKHHFRKVLFNEKSRFVMTEERMRGLIQGYEVEMRKEKGWPNRLSFEFFSQYSEEADKNKYGKKMRKMMRERNAHWDFFGVTKTLKGSNHYTATEIDKELNDFADFLKENGYHPTPVGYWDA